jgi:glycosyltransferase involved in cell wall biosynthesis
MKVVLVTPNFHEMRGNTITVQRISDGLKNLGVKTEVISITKGEDYRKLPKADIVHGFNAFQFYHYWQEQGSSTIPYVVTLTGTDLNHDLFSSKREQVVIDSLTNAKAIHVFNKEALSKLLRKAPYFQAKTMMIPQGAQSFQLNVDTYAEEDNAFVVVLPAGIRKIKNVPRAIEMLKTNHDSNKQIKLWIVGPVLEEEEGRIVAKLVEENKEWVSYLGPVPHEKMGGIYKSADIVLNTSFSEGQSGALLEAMAEGIPVVVSNNTGNRDIVSHGEVGFIYENAIEFNHYIKKLFEDQLLRKTMSKKGIDYIAKHHSVKKEAELIHDLYQTVLGKTSQD